MSRHSFMLLKSACALYASPSRKYRPLACGESDYSFCLRNLREIQRSSTTASDAVGSVRSLFPLGRMGKERFPMAAQPETERHWLSPTERTVITRSARRWKCRQGNSQDEAPVYPGEPHLPFSPTGLEHQPPTQAAGREYLLVESPPDGYVRCPLFLARWRSPARHRGTASSSSPCPSGSMGMKPCFNVLPWRRNQIVQETRTNPLGFTYHTLCEYAQHSFWATITISRQVRL